MAVDLQPIKDRLEQAKRLTLVGNQIFRHIARDQAVLVEVVEQHNAVMEKTKAFIEHLLAVEIPGHISETWANEILRDIERIGRD